mmetsp:Transcript_15473/g.31876  ORF Transcript_15473/g.31876 Transcript_15473/m.31876 type:complete len:120 (-) Transcript_15473:1399-1758(-)
MQAIAPAPAGVDNDPPKEYTASEWRVALDVDKDGVISRSDIIFVLWVLGAVLEINQFDTLLATVQTRPGEIKKWMGDAKMTPDELRVRVAVDKEEYLSGTMPAKKWLFLRFLTFFLRCQ